MFGSGSGSVRAKFRFDKIEDRKGIVNILYIFYFILIIFVA